MPKKQLPDQVSSPVALDALHRAKNELGIAETLPVPRSAVTPLTGTNSPDKIMIRGYVELFDELERIGEIQGRSINSEIVAGILEALAVGKHTAMMHRLLKAHLGDEMAGRVLAEVPVFDMAACKQPKKFTCRLPTSDCEAIRDGMLRAIAATASKPISMNTWLVRTLESWVNVQRQYFALLNAAAAMETPGIGE